MPVLLTRSSAPSGEILRRDASGGGPTLEEVLESARQQLDAGLPAPCPVCGGRVEPQPGAHGRCGSCGSTLG